jgi:hypothetical protein
VANRNRGINIPVELQTQDAVKDLAKLTKAVVQAQRIIISSNKNVNKSLKDTNDALRQQARNATGASKTVKNYGRDLGKATKQLNELDRVQDRVARSGKKLKGGLGEVSTLFRNFLSGGILVGIGKGFLSATTQVENLETQFKTLLGSADKAKDRLAELSEFASKTPFQLEEVAQASRVLETLTKGALSTGEGLRLVGDASATTGANFKELAVWVGRAYDGLQSNRPIGEATMRLQELGLVSGGTRTKIEQLQKQARGKEAWAVLEEELKKSSGGMEELSKTTTGLWSTTKDLTNAFFRSVDGILASGGALKKLLQTANEYLTVANEVYEAEARTARLREQAEFSKVLVAIARRNKLELMQRRGLELTRKQLEHKGRLEKFIAKESEEAGKDNIWIAEKSAESRIRQLEALKRVEGATKTAIRWVDKQLNQERQSLKNLKALGQERRKQSADKPTKKTLGPDVDPKTQATVDQLRATFSSLREDLAENTRGGGAVAEGVQSLFRELEGVGYDPDKLNDKYTAGFEQLWTTSEEFRAKFFNRRTEFFAEEAEARAQANSAEIEEIKKQWTLKQELEKALKTEETGYLLEDLERRGSLEYEILEADYKRKMKLAKDNAGAQYILEKNFQQKKQNLINDTFKAQVTATSRASQMVLNDLQTIFGETKALAIAEATIKGYQSAVNSFEFGSSIGGPPLGAVMAGLSLTATGAYIGRMSSQNFATGGFPTGANANVTMNERGQEAVLNASATARLGKENINRLNSGQSLDGSGNSTQAPANIQVTYSPTVSFTGAEQPDLFNTLENDLERVGELVGDAVRRGYASV